MLIKTRFPEYGLFYREPDIAYDPSCERSSRFQGGPEAGAPSGSDCGTTAVQCNGAGTSPYLDITPSNFERSGGPPAFTIAAISRKY